MIEKICNVLNVFLKNKDEVVLLWRPHPLMRATIQSMRPHLQENYESILNQYIAGGWGIYDDTSDLERAILISDAYYGDSSSVVQLYRTTNKPVMIQNVDVMEEKYIID
jgi:CDP-glycerol glycerophosphotransferase (TagB/SpsB family)